MLLLHHIVVLALVQGITEFLPVSSSAHLILVPLVTGWPDQGLIVDIAVHVGTLFAVLLYFRRDVAGIAAGGLSLLTGRVEPGGRLALQVALASVPIFAAGFLIKDLAFGAERDLELLVTVLAATSIGFGLLLYVADRVGAVAGTVERMSYRDALVVGLFQALALIPGTSRSGACMTAGRFLGMGRSEAARFALLLSIPAILGAGALTALELARIGDVALTRDALVAAALAFVSALAAIALMMRWLKHADFTPFVVYRVGLGIVLLFLLHADVFQR